MARRDWPVWTAIFALLVTTLVLSACARPVASHRAPAVDAGGSALPASAPLRPSTSEILEAYGRLPLHAVATALAGNQTTSASVTINK